jgi:hypothetical protein
VRLVEFEFDVLISSSLFVGRASLAKRGWLPVICAEMPNWTPCAGFGTRKRRWRPLVQLLVSGIGPGDQDLLEDV